MVSDKAPTPGLAVRQLLPPSQAQVQCLWNFLPPGDRWADLEGHQLVTHHKGPSTTQKPHPPYIIPTPGGTSPGLRHLYSPSLLRSFDPSAPASSGCKAPEGLNPRKAAGSNTQGRKKSKLCLHPGTSWKRISGSLSLKTSATSPTDGPSFLICTGESHIPCLGVGGFPKDIRENKVG